MNGIVCDRCGKALLIEEPVRYTMQLRITAAYDPLELTTRDLEADLREEVADLLARTDGMTEKELAESVMADRLFDLCPPCSREVLENPFGRGA